MKRLALLPFAGPIRRDSSSGTGSGRASMRRYVSAIMVLSVAFGTGCSDSIGAPDFEESFGQPAFAVFHTDPPATVTPVAGGFVLRKELGGFGAYGVADERSDILFFPEDDQWNFDVSVISDEIVSATAVVSLVLDDHFGRPATDYVGTITLNGTEVFSGGFSSLGVAHGVSVSGRFANWKSVRFSFSDLAPSTYTVAIDNNTTGPFFHVLGDWIAIDFIEIHVETTPAVIEADIDIKPGSDPNSINLGTRGDIPVAILTTDDFDAADVDASTVTLGDDDGNDTNVAARRNGSVKASLEDVDDDGDLDLILHFETQALVANGDLDASSTELILNGETTGGLVIQGSDAVNIVP